MTPKEFLWCGEGDLNPQAIRRICKLLIPHPVKQAKTAKKAPLGHNLGTRALWFRTDLADFSGLRERHIDNPDRPEGHMSSALQRRTERLDYSCFLTELEAKCLNYRIPSMRSSHKTSLAA
jgi:hypothetical protein